MEFLAEGAHQAQVNACALTETKGGEEQITVEFKTSSGDLVQAKYGFKTDKQFDFSMSQLRALGWKGDDLSTVVLDAERTHSITVKHDVGNDGKTYVSATVNTGGVSRFALPPERAKTFAEKMKARVQAFDATGKSEIATAPRTRSTEPRAPRERSTPRRSATAEPTKEWDGTGPDPNEDDFNF